MRAILLVLIGIPLWAGTTVSDTIKDASGRPIARGSVTFTPTAAFGNGSGGNWVSQSPVSAAITAGVFTVSLEPTPTGACYTVTFQPGSIAAPQLAAVPTTGSTLTLSQIINATGCVSANSVHVNFSDAETPSGTINGTNVTFTLAHTPNPAASLILTDNGLALRPGSDFTLSGATITFINGVAPQTSDTLQAWYRY